MSGLSALLPSHVDDTVRGYLQEDMPSMDVGGYVVGSSVCTALLLAKTPGTTLAGVPFVESVVRAVQCAGDAHPVEVEWMRSEGDEVGKDKEVVASVTGPVNRVLQVERTLLELISRCSAVATAAHAASMLAKETGFATRIAGTRKVTPGSFRMVEKYGLLVGGADTHRFDLSSMVMLKDNHVDACGGISLAVARCREACSFSHKIEVECRSLEDAREAAEAGADVIMLDNFSPEDAHEAASRIKEAFPQVLIEVSGGIRPDTLQAFCGPHVDILSMGSLTHGVPSVDFSLKVSSSRQ